MRRRSPAHRPGMWVDWTLVAVAFALALIGGLAIREANGGPVDGAVASATDR